MKRLLLLHGWHGSEVPHWQAWLAQEMVLEDWIVAFPKLSDAHAPSKEVWIAQAHAIVEEMAPDVVICHSLANILWFHLAPLLAIEIPRLLLCAPPRDHREIAEIASFFPYTLPAHLGAREVMMVASDNDPFSDLAQSRTLADALGIALQILHGAGHISSSSGFGPWPWVKEWVMEEYTK